jgi:predicted enzyme related to lactoylglutathione lyase
MPKYEFQPGTFCWIELAAADRRAAAEYYNALFGWTTRDLPMGPNPDDVYGMFVHDGVECGAVYTKQPDARPHWLSYIATANVDDTAAKAKSLGAKAADPFDVFEAGRMSHITDPQGASFAAWQPKQATPFVRDENNTLCWNELMTSDIDGAREFYKSLFDWNLKVSPEYTEMHAGEKAVGGMMQHPMPGAPPSWTPYIMVESVDAIVEKAKSLGSQIFVQNDVPNVGRFAYIGDPQGAVFAVFTPAAR